jgi:hypothetical protein
MKVYKVESVVNFPEEDAILKCEEIDLHLYTTYPAIFAHLKSRGIYFLDNHIKNAEYIVDVDYNLLESDDWYFANKINTIKKHLRESKINLLLD